jgi:predicted amidohydrolase YtcJ
MYTVNAAYASFEENLKGSIEEGKLADLTVLSGDPRKTPASKIGETKVIMTIVGGKVLYPEVSS